MTTPLAQLETRGTLRGLYRPPLACDFRLASGVLCGDDVVVLWNERELCARHFSLYSTMGGMNDTPKPLALEDRVNMLETKLAEMELHQISLREETAKMKRVASRMTELHTAMGRLLSEVVGVLVDLEDMEAREQPSGPQRGPQRTP